VPVGLVHAEHEVARHAVAVCGLHEIVVPAAHAVDVVAKVDVGVEDLGVRRELATELLVEGRKQSLRSLEHLVHGFSLRFGVPAAGEVIRHRLERDLQV
jgi:hypothetical protein